LLRFIDKICDQVSDAVLDAIIREDPLARVACGKLNIDILSVVNFEKNFYSFF